jgi:hypothetical protein
MTTDKDKDENILKTQDAIDYAFKKLEAVRGEPLTMDFASKDGKLREIMDLLSGGTPFARILSFLVDYHSEFGNKKMAKLHLFNDENESTKGCIVSSLS